MGNGILSRANSGDGAKIGTIKLSARDSLGEKWALCNGDPVTGGGDDTLEVKYHWKPVDNKIDNFYIHKASVVGSDYITSSIVYDHVNNKYYHIEAYYPTNSRTVLSIKEISNNFDIIQNAADITTSYTTTVDKYNISKFECCINNGIIFLLVPRKYNSSSVEKHDIYYMDSANMALATGTTSISISYTSTDKTPDFSFTSPSAKYITHLIPSAYGDPIQYLEFMQIYDSASTVRISYRHWNLGSYSSTQKVVEIPCALYGGVPTDGGIFGYAVSKNCTLILPSFICTSGYATKCHFIFPTTGSTIDIDSVYELPYANPSSMIKCKTLVTPSCIDYENDIFCCVGYDGGIYKIQIIDDVISSELVNSTWTDYAQHINFEFAAIKFHTQYKADGTKQLYMFIVGEEGSYVAPINDITTFGPDAVFTEIPNLQAKDVLTGNVLTDAAFVNRLLIINDKNNNDIMFYEQSLPEIDKPGVNAFIKIKN